jgi:NTE family protein
VNFYKKIILIIFLLLLTNLNAQEAKVISIQTKTKNLPYGLNQKIPSAYPEVGIAMSGGGARGLAQIGVLKAFCEEGIDVSLVAGTSIGSIIGGAFASGYSLEEIDSIVKSTDWNRLLSLNNPSERRELFIDQKIGEDRSLFTLRLDGFSPVLPTSFNEGLRLSNYLALLCLSAPVVPENNFDDLLVRYRAVCTNLIDGQPVVLSDGSLSRAMRASSSVSFLLAPVVVDTLTLVDGGLVSNIPVNTVMEMGADYVIAINTTSNLREQEDLEVPWNIADQTVSIPMKKLEQAELSKADFLIKPDIDEWTSTDFINIDSLIFTSYTYTKKLTPELKRQLDSIMIFNSGIEIFWVKNPAMPKNPGELEKEYLEKYVQMDSVSSYEIFKDAAELYNRGHFDSLSVKVEEKENTNQIVFQYLLNPIINEVEIISNGIMDSSGAAFLINFLRGKPYSGKFIYDAVRKQIVDYKRKGFILFKLKSHNFDENTGKLVLEFDGGLISKVNINSETSKTVVNRELNIKAGNYLIYSDLEEGLMRLRATGLFDDINLSIEQSDSGTFLNLDVNEKISSLLKIGFLVDNAYNAQLGVDIRDVNLLHSGTELGLFLFGGASNRAYILEHISYRILDTYFTYKLNAYYKFSDIDVYTQNTSESGNTFSSDYRGKYRQIFYGGSFSIGSQLEKFGKLIFTGKYQYDEVKNKEGSTVVPYETKIVSLKIDAIVDNQNRYPYPEDGLLFNGFYETAQSFLGGDESYLLFSADLRYYFKLSSRQVLSPRVQIGFGDKTLPLSEQFMLGGLYSFFGAHQNEFRGRQIFLTSVMYQYKLPFKIFFDTYTWFRYDVGSTWEQQEQIRFKDLRHGIGGAISFDTPVGPADFSIGRSFIISQGLTEDSFVWGDVMFYFSIGHAVNF